VATRRGRGQVQGAWSHLGAVGRGLRPPAAAGSPGAPRCIHWGGPRGGPRALLRGGGVRAGPGWGQAPPGAPQPQASPSSAPPPPNLSVSRLPFPKFVGFQAPLPQICRFPGPPFPNLSVSRPPFP